MILILSDTTNKNPKPKVTRAEGLSTFITYYSIVQSSSLYIPAITKNPMVKKNQKNHWA